MCVGRGIHAYSAPGREIRALMCVVVVCVAVYVAVCRAPSYWAVLYHIFDSTRCFIVSTHCSTLQHTVAHCNALQIRLPLVDEKGHHATTHCTTLQHTATHCNRLHRAATYCNALQIRCNSLQHTETHCNTLQHTATHCNTLQLAADSAVIGR